MFLYYLFAVSWRTFQTNIWKYIPSGVLVVPRAIYYFIVHGCMANETFEEFLRSKETSIRLKLIIPENVSHPRNIFLSSWEISAVIYLKKKEKCGKTGFNVKRFVFNYLYLSYVIGLNVLTLILWLTYLWNLFLNRIKSCVWIFIGIKYSFYKKSLFIFSSLVTLWNTNYCNITGLTSLKIL